MDLIAETSWLRLLWGCHLTLVIAGFLKVFLGGSSLEKLKTDTPSDELDLGWFKFRKRSSQYYMVGAVFTGVLLLKQIGAYCWGREPNPFLLHLVEKVSTPHVQHTDSTRTILASSLLFVHLGRHVYECMRIRIFSRRPTLNVLELVMSYCHYIAVALTLVAEGPALSQLEGGFDWSSLHVKELAGGSLFLLGSVLQHRCSKSLAKLRRNRAGHIVTSNYKMPKGGWFDLVLCPHYFAETLCFAGIGLVLGVEHGTFWLMFANLVATHMFLSVNTKNFYLKKFASDCPKDTSRFIPFLF